MLTEELLVKEYVRVVMNHYPKAGKLLRHSHVKVLTTHVGQPPKRLQYIGIYCSDELFPLVQAETDVLREVAQDMGMMDIVCRNANKLLRDPLSTVRQTSPRFWLELQWVSVTPKPRG